MSALLLTSGVALAASASPSPKACSVWVLAAHQDKQIEALLAPPALPMAVSLTEPEIEVRATEIQARYGGLLLGEPARFVFVIAPDQLNSPARGLRVTRLGPCPKTGSDRERNRCEEPEMGAALAAMDDALSRRVKAKGSTLRWHCAGDPEHASEGESLGTTLRRVDHLLSVGDREEAGVQIDKLLVRLGDRELKIPELIDLASLLQVLGRREEADKRYADAVRRWHERKLDRGDVEEALNVPLEERFIAALMALGEVDEAKERLERCWEVRQGKSTCSALPAAKALEARQAFEEAAELLELALSRSAKPAKALFMERIGLASRHETADRELQLAKRAATFWPKEPEVIDALATAQFRSGNHREAIALFERVYRLDPAFPGTLGRLSGAFNQMAGVAGTPGHPLKVWQKLRDEMLKRADSGSADVVAIFTKGVALYYDGELDEAIETMKRVEDRLPTEARVFIYQGMAHFWQGRQAKAEALIARAREANPYDSDVYYCYAQVSYKKDRPGAIKSLRRYIAMSEAPGALRFEKKTERVKKELGLLLAGKDLPDWDRPRRRDVREGPDKNGASAPVDSKRELPPLSWLLALIALLGLGGFILWRRSKNKT